MIEASVRKTIGSLSLSADLSDGGFVCLAGRNGSGKSSLFNLMTGKLAMDEGFVKVNGQDVTRLATERKGIVMVTPSSAIPHLTVDSHLRLGAALAGNRVSDARLLEVKKALGIDYAGRVRTLSLGMKERVSLATALLSGRKVILVDEAFSNLHDREGFVAAYRGLASEAGMDVIFSSQTDEDGAMADHLYSIVGGVTQRLK